MDKELRFSTQGNIFKCGKVLCKINKLKSSISLVSGHLEGLVSIFLKNAIWHILQQIYKLIFLMLIFVEKNKYIHFSHVAL